MVLQTTVLTKCLLFLPQGSNENEDKSEVQAIIDSTPELDMDKDLSGYKGSRYFMTTFSL